MDSMAVLSGFKLAMSIWTTVRSPSSQLTNTFCFSSSCSPGVTGWYLIQKQLNSTQTQTQLNLILHTNISKETQISKKVRHGETFPRHFPVPKPPTNVCLGKIFCLSKAMRYTEPDFPRSTSTPATSELQRGFRGPSSPSKASKFSKTLISGAESPPEDSSAGRTSVSSTTVLLCTMSFRRVWYFPSCCALSLANLGTDRAVKANHVQETKRIWCGGKKHCRHSRSSSPMSPPTASH